MEGCVITAGPHRPARVLILWKCDILHCFQACTALIRLCCKKGTLSLICTPVDKLYKIRIAHNGITCYVDFFPVYHLLALYYYAVVEKQVKNHSVKIGEFVIETATGDNINLKDSTKCILQISADECSALINIFGNFYLCKQKNSFPLSMLQTHALFPVNVLGNKCCFHMLSSMLLAMYQPIMSLEKFVGSLKNLLVDKIFDRYPHSMTEAEKTLMTIVQPIAYLLHEDKTLFENLLVITIIRYIQSTTIESIAVFSQDVDILYKKIKCT